MRRRRCVSYSAQSKRGSDLVFQHAKNVEIQDPTLSLALSRAFRGRGSPRADLRKTRTRDEALRVYAFALSSDSPTDEIRARFTKLAGGKAAADILSGKHKDGPAGMRTHALTVKSAAEGSAGFFILVGAKGVEDVRFIKGDEPLKPLVEELRRMVFAGAVPLDSEARIVRRATVTCGGSAAAKNRGCTARLDPTDTARLD